MGNEYPSDNSGWHRAEPSGIPMNDLEPFEIEMLRAQQQQQQQQQKGSERIDLTQVEAFLEEAGPEAGGTYIYGLIAELKRCYEMIDSVNQEMLATRAKMLSNENVDWEDPLVREIADTLLLLD